jgi:hypothetical protein
MTLFRPASFRPVLNIGLLALALLIPAGGLAHAEPHTILLEAEAFDALGGWVIDTQVMDQMGSPLLMAHGLGRPVADAATRVAFPAAGTYRVLVRTRGWAATFDAPESPGRFKLLVGGRPLPVVFGTEGEAWHWQEGGTVEITEANRETTAALRDLTGFNGRCDAIVFTTDPGLTPPNEGQAMARFRREMLGHPERPADVGPYDLVVVGGGVAGLCTAVSAARLGLTVALIQDRPLLGDVILKQQDIVGRRAFPDAAVTTTWTIDLHYPTDFQKRHFAGKEFRARAEHVHIQPYPVPYRCFYSRNVDNLFMAGRNISVTHVALGTVRVMRTLGMVGEVVGMAAAVCKRHDVDPRQVYTDHLDELKELMTRGVGKLPLPASARPPTPPPWLADAGENLARAAEVSVSSYHDPQQYPARNINDGRFDYADNRLRWVSGDETPGTVELAWETVQQIGAVRIVTGYAAGAAGPRDPIADFVLQYHDGREYRDIEATRTTGNESVDWHARFPAVTTARLRLVVTLSPDNRSRIGQIEAYGPVAAKQ